nr:pyrroline-5-carboxylate reductase [Spirochaetota bacterium]
MSKVLFVGAGNMGRAIIEGVLKKGSFTKSNVFFYEVNEDTASNIEKEFGIERILKMDERVKEASIIILAVKPQTFKNFINDKEALNLRGFITEKQTIVSIMAGISIQKIEEFFGEGIPVIRAMPNTAALVGLSATAMSFSKSVSQDNLERVKEAFLAVGIVEVVDEKLIDAVTGLSGSGPAYVFMFIE